MHTMSIEKEQVNRTEQIWNEYHRNLHQFIQKRIANPSVAEDILQDVFFKIHTSIHTLKDNGKLQAWIYQITRNAIIDYYRSHKKMEELPEFLLNPEIDNKDKITHEFGSCFLPLIRNLPGHYSETLTLSDFNGLKQKEIAEKQGISLAGVKKRIERGRSMIKEILLEKCKFEYDRRGSISDYDCRNTNCNMN